MPEPTDPHRDAQIEAVIGQLDYCGLNPGHGAEYVAARLVDAVNAAGPSRPTPHLDSVKRELAEANQKIDAYCAAFREHRAVYERALARWRLDDVQRRAIAHPGLDALLDWLMVHADEQRQRADQGEARGYQQAVDNARNRLGYLDWVNANPYRAAQSDTWQQQLADYLEAVGPGRESAQTGRDGPGVDPGTDDAGTGGSGTEDGHG